MRINHYLYFNFNDRLVSLLPRMNSKMFGILMAFIFIAGACGLDNPYSERKYKHPYYSEVALCACDLSQSKCDTYCCCDPDCSEQSMQNESCTQGLFGGSDLGKILRMNCTVNKTHDESPWYSLLCIHRHNSPYIGQYFKVLPKLTGHAQYERLMEETGKLPSSYEDPARHAFIINNTEHYMHGTSIKSVYNMKDGIVGKLGLPVETLTGMCVQAPVRYLVNQASSCSKRMTREACKAGQGTVLDISVYLAGDKEAAASGLLAQVLSFNNHLNVTSTKVNYYMTDSPEAYLFGIKQERKSEKGHEATLEELIAKTRVSSSKVKFSENVRNIRIQKLEGQPGSITYDEGRGVCRNVVLEVRYELVWSGIQIKEVRADILTGDIDLSSLTDHGKNRTKAYLLQFFKAKFSHVRLSNKTTGGQREIVHRSGNPGYNMGMPIVFAVIQENKVNGKMQIRHNSVGLQTWGHNSPSSSCQDSSLIKIGFGVDTISECYVTVTRSELKNCKKLAAKLRHFVFNLTRSVAVSKYGTDNFTDPNNFVRIVRDELKLNLTGSNNNLTETWLEKVEEVCGVPARMRTTFLYTDSGNIQGRQVNLINGVRVRLIYENWRWICPRINGRKRAGCSNRQRFPIRSEVEFVEVPAVWHNQNTTKFWLIQESLSCNGNICWKDMMLPFTDNTTGDQVAKSVEIVMATLLFLVPTLCFSRFAVIL